MSIACYHAWLYMCGGTERTLLEVARRSRHKWTFYTNFYKPEDTFEGFEGLDVVVLGRVPIKRGFMQTGQVMWRVFSQRLPMNKHDILFIYSGAVDDFATFRNHQKPSVCFCWTPLKMIHDPDCKAQFKRRFPAKAPLLHILGALYRPLERLAWSGYDYVIACSKEVENRILKARLAQKEKMEVLYAGVDRDVMKPTWQFEKFFLVVSRFKYWKNVELAIRAFIEFIELSETGSDFRLVVAGQIDKSDLRYFEELKATASSCPGIEFVTNPTAEQLDTLYSSCYAVLNTTPNEDWGIVTLEANAFGKAVIAVDRGGPKESQIDGVTGFLTENDPMAFARKMAVLAEDEKLTHRMGRAARENSSKYEWSTFVNRLDDLFEELAAKGSVASH
ncbi:glycosyltransferase [Acidobacteriota bacterium]